MFVKYLKFAVFAVIAGALSSAQASDRPFELYIDADYSISAAAARAIELGVRTALDEADYSVGGMEFRLVPMDHRGNVKRARRTYEQYLKNDRALAIIGGLHSPPYLTNKDFINSNGILTLLPWSAAGPITRASAGQDNWIFRLSVDDTKSGSFLIREAVEGGGCQKVALILLDSGWGRASQKTLTQALLVREMIPVTTEFFSTAIGKGTARSIAARIERSGADCGVLLANWDNGALVLQALYDNGNDIRIFSHWGIMGGRFTTEVNDTARRALHLRVLQTCALRKEREENAVLRNALDAASGGEAASVADLPASTGFVHGYDLTRVLMAAIAQAAESETWALASIQEKRAAVRHALEHLEQPVSGILNHYDPPFSPFGEHTPDAHEALGFEDLCIAKFRADGRLEDAR